MAPTNAQPTALRAAVFVSPKAAALLLGPVGTLFEPQRIWVADGSAAGV